MRDVSAKWPLIDTDSLALEGPGVALYSLRLERQTLVSGAGARAGFTERLGAPVGWPAPARGEAYALGLGRDRLLLVNDPALEDGWDARAGLAVSDMSGGYAVFGLRGPGIGAVLARAGEIDPTRPSRSVARLFLGLEVLLYWHEAAPGGEQALRLHVPACHAMTLVEALGAVFRAIGD